MNHAIRDAMPGKRPFWRKWGFWWLVLLSLVVVGSVSERVDAHRLTRNDWKQKAAAHFTLASNHLLGADVNRFTDLMGQPDNTQTIGNRTLWYYRCSDGSIQLVMTVDPALAGVIVAAINDY